MKPLVFASAIGVLLFESGAIAAFPTLALKPICLSQLGAPVCIANAADGSNRLFVCEQRGKIRIIQNGMLLPTPFLDVGAKLVAERAGFDERGLLGVAFHPGYSTPASPGYRRFYVFYSANSPNAPGTTTDPVNCRTTIAEYKVSANDPNVADPASERILLTFDKPQFNHNGGQLEFGSDGFLYMSTGDGGGADDNDAGHTGGSTSKPSGALGNAHDKTRLLGKLLRIDPLGTNGPGGQYGIPATNPFVGAGGGVREEIYAYGLRNPWRFSFDPANGRLFCADVGQARVEEIDIITSGSNYGWRQKEGSFDFDATAPDGGPPLIAPIAQYQHPGINPSLGLQSIGISVTGGYVYRGTAIPQLVGKYVFGDWSASFGTPSGTLLGLEETTPNNWTLSVLPLNTSNPIPTRIMAFGRDEQGEIYVATKVTQAPSQNDPGTGLPTGGIYKIVPLITTDVTMNPTKDNTIFDDHLDNSNGLGNLFAGRTLNFGSRRALLAFDPAGTIPAGATLNSASLTLVATNSKASGAAFTLTKVTEDWGEGASNAGSTGGDGVPAQPGDATWRYRFYNTSTWATLGGSFAATTSASTNISGIGTYTWTGASLLSDMQSWMTSPSTNFGWILRGDEANTSATQFSSRENVTVANRPKLTVNYTSPPPLTRREQWLQQYFFVGQYVDDFADLDGDGFNNAIEYATAASPLAAAPASPPVQITAVNSGGSTTFTITFRRDPRATDVTYRLQTSSDLATWTTVVQSVGGAAPTGTAFLSESVIAGESPVTLVTARETLVGEPKRFARLQVVR